MAKTKSLKDRITERYGASNRYTFTEKGNRKQNRVVRSSKRKVRGR